MYVSFSITHYIHTLGEIMQGEYIINVGLCTFQCPCSTFVLSNFMESCKLLKWGGGGEEH
jgi:hypothetical protein